MIAPTTVGARAAKLDALRAAAQRQINDGEDWIGPLNRGLLLTGATWQESAQVCSPAVWHARRTGRDVLKDLESRPMPGADLSAARHRTWWHLYFTAHRFDFRCQAIRTVFQALDPPGAEHADPYMRAHEVFAVLGRSQPAGLGMLDDLLADDYAATSQEVLHVVLQGLWLGHLLPGRAERILHLTGLRVLARSADPIALMRAAGALRQLGRHRQALAAIDDVIEALPAGDPAVHADLVRERTLITCAIDLTGCPTPTGGNTPLIFGVSQRARTATGFLQQASAGKPPDSAAPIAGALVAVWPVLAAHTAPDDFHRWSAAQWADFLDDPLLEHPFAASPAGDRRALFHLQLALGPDERVLNTGEWTYAAHTVLASLGLCGPDGDGPHRWIALGASPRHLHLIANLISEDGTWAPLPEPLVLHLRHQVRLLVDTLNRPPARSASRDEDPTVASLPTPHGHEGLLGEITDGAAGLLAQVRRRIEQAAIHAADSPDLRGAGADRRLEWIARRLHGIQEDLRDIIHTLDSPTPPPHLATAPSSFTRPAPAPTPLPAPRRRTPVR